MAQDEVYTATVYAQWKYEVKDGGAVIVGTTQTSGSVTIPTEIDGYTVTGIGADMFAGCTGISSVVIPQSVWDVREGAFANCTGLRRVEAAKGLKGTLGAQNVFEGCPANLEIVYVETATISNVAAKQRYPWNGKVDLKFTIDGTSGTKYDTSFTAKDVTGGTNLTMKTLYKSNGTAANVAKEQLQLGIYNVGFVDEWIDGGWMLCAWECE